MSLKILNTINMPDEFKGIQNFNLYLYPGFKKELTNSIKEMQSNNEKNIIDKDCDYKNHTIPFTIMSIPEIENELEIQKNFKENFKTSSIKEMKYSVITDKNNELFLTIKIIFADNRELLTETKQLIYNDTVYDF